MKILFLLPSLSIGGLERVQVTLANALAERGHDVTVMTYGKSSALAAELRPTVRFIAKGLKPHPIGGRIPWIRYKYYDDGKWEKRTSPARLHHYYVGDEEYDVEVGFFRGLSIKTISGYPRKSKARHIAWVHNDFRKCGGYNFEFKNNEAVKQAYRRYDKIICVSNEARLGFIDVIGDTGNLCTIYNPLAVNDILKKSTEAPSTNTPRHRFNAVIVGHLLDGHKGQKRLIEAVYQLHSEGIDIGLTIVGGGQDETMLKDKVKSLDANDYIYFTGEVKNPYPYIKQADLLVCASHYEGYNLTVAEALILGTPVLSTRCTGPVEILDDGKYGMIVENSAQGLIDGLRRLATDSTLLTSYRKAATQRRIFFDENKIISQIENTFR